MTKNKNLVIIEDNESFLESLKDALEIRGFNVDGFLKGKDGLKTVYKSIPDLVIIDIRLPDIDGFQICREIKNNSKTASIPIILMTGDKTVDIDMGFSVGADDCLIKPFDVEILVSLIKKYIGGYKILLIDDDREFCSIIKDVLSKNRFEINAIYEGINILDLINSDRPDLILLDITLPKPPDGIEILKIIKQNRDTRKIPVIMLTAWEYAEDIDKSFSLGANDYIFKPFTNEELIAKIKKNLV